MQDGNTPLHLASQRGNPAVIQCLYKHGANLFIENKVQNALTHYYTQIIFDYFQAGKTPYDLARKEHHCTTCSYLEECMERENGLLKVNLYLI